MNILRNIDAHLMKVVPIESSRRELSIGAGFIEIGSIKTWLIDGLKLHLKNKRIVY